MAETDLFMNDFDEFVVRDELRNKRHLIKNFDDLIEFLKYVEENCNTGYGTAPRAMAQASLATAYYLSDKFGITSFQAGFVMWDFIMDWLYGGNQCGLKIVDYDDMLYPQYEYKFEKIISKDVWAELQKQAKKNLEDRDYANPIVVEHWKSMSEGVVPFGYVVEN